MDQRFDENTCGIINLNKPAGMTSHDCVSALRRLTGVRRIGHTGTLDPMATGVLPLCIGSAARINEYLELDSKSYRCTVQLGVTTDTLDVWGQVSTDCRSRLFEELGSPQEGQINEKTTLLLRRVEEILWEFRGEISQIPPKYSAIRVDGKRLYEYARKGLEVEIKPRTVFIRGIGLVSFHPEKLQACFDVECSKGTYIRSICAKLGERLSCGAAMCGLIRTGSGRFTLSEAVDLEQLKENPQEAFDHLLPADFPLVHFGKIMVNENRAKWFVSGGKLAGRDVEIQKEPLYGTGEGEPEDAFRRWTSQRLNGDDRFRRAYNVYRRDGVFLGVAVYQPESGLYQADKIFWRQG